VEIVPSSLEGAMSISGSGPDPLSKNPLGLTHRDELSVQTGSPAAWDRADRASVTVGTYSDYPAAQAAVDYLSDNGFPVEHVTVVGTDLRLVETVLGRMTTARAGLAGLISGAWFGLFIGLLLGLFTSRGWLVILVAAVLIGAFWGAAFGAVAHAMTGGRRDFTSAKFLQAGQYAVNVDVAVAEQARDLLARKALITP
jgi:hypothetical protein